jgi:transposase-like protein
MANHPQREQALQRCLEQGEPPSKVAAELGVAASTLRQEHDAQGQRQQQLVAELHQAAAALAELKLLLDQADRAAGTAAG